MTALPPRGRLRRTLCALCCASAILLGGCAPTPTPVVSATSPRPRATVTPLPTLTSQPAPVYTGVLTDRRAVSLTLEGYTDDASMRALAALLKQKSIPAVFFISGVAADEHADVIREISDAGFTIGNYGLNGEKNRESLDVLENLHQFRRSQALLTAATGHAPTLFRCNGTQYTQPLLQAATSAGLKAGVLPDAYLNHVSFTTPEDAFAYVRQITRGTVLSVKLGQALDADEYTGAVSGTTHLASDAEPFLSDRLSDSIAKTYANIVHVVDWLTTALADEGYVILPPQALTQERISMFDNPAELSAETLAMLNPNRYSVPKTDLPLSCGLETLAALPAPAATPEPDAKTTVSPSSTGKATVTPAAKASVAPATGGEPSATASVSAANTKFYKNAVFVGDTVTAGLESYVAWRRQTDPGYLGTARFLTSAGFGIGPALSQVSDSSVHPEVEGVKYTVPEALRRLGAQVAFLMPGQADARASTPEALIANLKLMVYEIRQQNPGLVLCLQTIPPGVPGRDALLTNERILRYNLALYEFCLQYAIPCVDVSFALSNAQGDLPEALCLDAGNAGFHLNDLGCERWLDAIRKPMTR